MERSQAGGDVMTSVKASRKPCCCILEQLAAGEGDVRKEGGRLSLNLHLTTLSHEIDMVYEWIKQDRTNFSIHALNILFVSDVTPIFLAVSFVLAVTQGCLR